MRSLVGLCAFTCVLGLAPAVTAAPSRQPHHRHHPRARRTSLPVSHGTVAGVVTAAGPASFSVETAGRREGVVNAMVDAANAITRTNPWYVWGGGHPQAGVATRKGHEVGFDCSGSVVAVLAGAGLWQPGSGVPNDSGVVAQLLRQGLIAPGPGRAPTEVTLYDDPGIHIFMNINGRYFGTSDGQGGTGRHGGAGWLADSAPDAHNPAFRQYHVLPAVLRDSTTFGHSFTFGSPAAPTTGMQLGDHVNVTYTGTDVGDMIATSVSYTGAISSAGTVASVTLDGGAFSLLGADGQTTTFALPQGLAVPGLALGDGVQVTYTRVSDKLRLHAVALMSQPTLVQATGTLETVAADGSAFTVADANGATLTFSTGGNGHLLTGVTGGDAVTVSYVAVGTALVAGRVEATVAAPGQPAPPAQSGT